MGCASQWKRTCPGNLLSLSQGHRIRRSRELITRGCIQALGRELGVQHSAQRLGLEAAHANCSGLERIICTERADTQLGLVYRGSERFAGNAAARLQSFQTRTECTVIRHGAV